MACVSVSRVVQTVLLASLCAALPRGLLGDDATDRAWHCSNDGFDRNIELFRREQGDPDAEFMCWVIYERDGIAEVLWQAQHDPGYCEPKVLELVENLETAGFDCRVAPLDGRGESRSEPPRASSDAADRGVTATRLPDNRTESRPKQNPTDQAADFRALLEAHYVGGYLDAMIGAMPEGFAVHSASGAVSPGRGDYLYLAPPQNFVKTLPDGSYVLVNTQRFERGSTTSFVNFGFHVIDQQFRFLGYGTAHTVETLKVLDVDSDKIVVSITATTAGCPEVRRTRVIPWHENVYGNDGPGTTTRLDAAEAVDCQDTTDE